jgi:DNA polymerase (family X)
MKGLDTSSVAALQREFGQRSSLRGGNPFRAKAHARAADNLLAPSLPLETVIAQDHLRDVPGIGDVIAGGTHPALEKCAQKSPRACWTY